MEEDDGGDDSEFGSVTSSQASLLKHSRFVGLSPDRRARTETDSDTGSDHTEVFGDQFASPLVQTPILTSQDSVFRTPPEEPYLSSAADPDTTVRVSVTDPASASVTATRDSVSPSFGAERVRVLVETPASAPSISTEDVRVSGAESASTTGDSESPSSRSKLVRVLEATPASSPSSGTVNVRVSEIEPDSAFVGTNGDSAFPSSGAGNVRVSGEATVSAPPHISSRNVTVLGKRSGSASAAPTKKFRVLDAANVSDEDGLCVSLKDVMEAILRNSGEAKGTEYEKLSIVDILRNSGLRFPD